MDQRHIQLFQDLLLAEEQIRKLCASESDNDNDDGGEEGNKRVLT